MPLKYDLPMCVFISHGLGNRLFNLKSVNLVIKELEVLHF